MLLQAWPCRSSALKNTEVWGTNLSRCFTPTVPPKYKYVVMHHCFERFGLPPLQMSIREVIYCLYGSLHTHTHIHTYTHVQTYARVHSCTQTTTTSLRWRSPSVMALRRCVPSGGSSFGVVLLCVVFCCQCKVVLVKRQVWVPLSGSSFGVALCVGSCYKCEAFLKGTTL